MKRLILLLSFSILFLSSCTKRDYISEEPDAYEWMHTRDKGIVAYIDYFTGNYIVDTYQGFAVVESWSGITPHTYDDEYAFFSSRGPQTIYNRSGNYFSQVRIVDSWLSWQEAMFIIEELNYNGY